MSRIGSNIPHSCHKKQCNGKVANITQSITDSIHLSSKQIFLLSSLYRILYFGLYIVTKKYVKFYIKLITPVSLYPTVLMVVAKN